MNNSKIEKTFSIKTKLIFAGEFTIKAHNQKDALEKIKKSCGATLGNINSIDNDIDWNFPLHADIEIQA